MSGRLGRGSFRHPPGRRNGASKGNDNIRRGGGICHQFQRGSCRFGASCRFSHEVPPASGNHPARPLSDDNFADFKRLIRKGALYAGSGTAHARSTSVWASALLVLEADNQDAQQFIAKDIASDGFEGYNLIDKTAQMSGRDDEMNIRCAYDFLRVITHPSFLDPLSLDTFVSTIYNFFSGRNGDRAITFFLKLCRQLMAFHQMYDRIPGSTVIEFATLILRALSELLNRESRVRFHENIPTLLDEVQILTALDEPNTDTDTITRRINLLQRLVTRETSRLTDTVNDAPEASNTPFIRSTFPTQMVLPGGRHDNDYADIGQIQILPTHGEINCDMEECLPSTDFTQPHFLNDPVQRHIDSAFRLLRHDIFGPVKDILKDLLSQGASGARCKPHVTRNIRARVYMGASIQHILVEKNSLEAVVRFESPHQLHGKSASERRRWWQESSRLEEGSLVVLLSAQAEENSLLFLEVTTKNTAKEKDDSKRASLVTDGNYACLGVKLATLTPHTLSLLTKFHGERTVGVLVEFHNLIPATFVPILSSLQQMIRDGELAFQRWILPTAPLDGVSVNSNIPPPAYARGPGFDFDLRPIMEDGRLLVSTPQQDALPMLERGTTLDRGQCEALYAALTKEYALIQGPPGTGKSYVGVQLVRVLLQNKEKVDAGPILVM